METISSFSGKYAYLSNFYPCRVSLDGVTYPSIEHAYQAAKTTIFAQREKIRMAETPGQAKKLGRRLGIRLGWDEMKASVMLDLLEQKFRQPVFRKALVETGETVLIEGNDWHDCYWGICYCGNCVGKGSNHLGNSIMFIRQELGSE